MSDSLFQGTSLDTQSGKAGISRVTPPSLARRYQCLPAILHMTNQVPIPDYSKGSRGLSVYRSKKMNGVDLNFSFSIMITFIQYRLMDVFIVFTISMLRINQRALLFLRLFPKIYLVPH